MTIDITEIRLQGLGIERFKPDRAVDKFYRDALAYLVFKWSFFAQIIYTDMNLVYTKSEVIPIAGTDAKSIFLNPDGFEENDIKDVLEIVFVLAHEVTHRVLYDIVMGHVWMREGQVPIGGGQFLPYHHELMGAAMDMRINAMLVHEKVGRMPKVGWYDKSFSAEGRESCVEIYAKMFKRMKEIMALLKGFDVHIPPWMKQVEEDKGRREQMILAAAQVAEMSGGKVPGNLKRTIDDILNPKIPWPMHLRSAMRRKSGDPKPDWNLQNRRLAGRQPPLYWPGKGHKGAGIVVCGADNSGSITPHVANVFGSEMAGIVHDLHPVQFIVIWCDAEVTRVDIVDEPDDLNALFADWKTTGIGGGGGTSFIPVFEKIEEMGITPDMLVYFTDMMGRFPSDAPPYPTIWASTTLNCKGPFGETVEVEI